MGTINLELRRVRVKAREVTDGGDLHIHIQLLQVRTH